MRRKPKENNFKNVLEAIRDLIRESNRLFFIIILNEIKLNKNSFKYLSFFLFVFSDDVINGAGGDEAANKNNVVPQVQNDYYFYSILNRGFWISNFEIVVAFALTCRHFSLILLRHSTKMDTIFRERKRSGRRRW